MSYYANNPHDQNEAPRCSECDECMSPIEKRGCVNEWQCDNLQCENCPDYRKFTIVDENGVNYGDGTAEEMRALLSELTTGAPLVAHWWTVISPETDDIYLDWSGGNEDKL